MKDLSCKHYRALLDAMGRAKQASALKKMGLERLYWDLHKDVTTDPGPRRMRNLSHDDSIITNRCDEDCSSNFDIVQQHVLNDRSKHERSPNECLRVHSKGTIEFVLGYRDDPKNYIGLRFEVIVLIPTEISDQSTVEQLTDPCTQSIRTWGPRCQRTAWSGKRSVVRRTASTQCADETRTGSAVEA